MHESETNFIQYRNGSGDFGWQKDGNKTGDETTATKEYQQQNIRGVKLMKQIKITGHEVYSRKTPCELSKEYAAIVFNEMVKIAYEKVYGVKIKDSNECRKILKEMGIEKNDERRSNQKSSSASSDRRSFKN